MTRTERIANLAGVVVPFAGILAAIVLLWQRAVDGTDLAIFAGMYLITATGCERLSNHVITLEPG